MPPPEPHTFIPLNLPADEIPAWMGQFSLSAPPNSDLWRKTPARDTYTAPMLYKRLRHPFVSAEVTVCADWRLEWDQAGLVIFAGAPPCQQQRPPPNTTTTSATTDGSPPPYSLHTPQSKWVKVGLEFYNDSLNATSVCATPDGADWSRSALPPYHSDTGDLRVKLERIGYALWVHYEDARHGWKKMREVTWFFWGVEDKCVWVGVYASRPAQFPATRFEREGIGAGSTGGSANRWFDRRLVVEFEGLEIY
jgi:regulation of enolase protein 1 (concanavalin A-like superfamily)